MAVKEMLIPVMPRFDGAFQPSRQMASRVFHSNTSKAMSMPISFSICCTASFIAMGCIWPEPEVEMPTVMAHG